MITRRLRRAAPKPRPKPRPKPKAPVKKAFDSSKMVGGPGYKPPKPPSAPAPGYRRGSKPPEFALKPAAKPKPRASVKRKPRTRRAVTRRRRA